MASKKDSSRNSPVQEGDHVFQSRRRDMVSQLMRYGISDKRVLDAFLQVPRHLFFDIADRTYAYDDGAFPIGFGQTISQPYTVAYMTAILSKRCPAGKVLEIGTGSGYQAAILDAMGYRVYTVERIEGLYERSGRVFDRLGLHVQQMLGDGSGGWLSEAPFDGIIVTAGAPDVPHSLVSQLKVGGCLVIPVGGSDGQWMTVVTKTAAGFRREVYERFAFVPLIGREGWNEVDDGG
ncbi:MAG: protein-L-isoaspartate(D-aspartate) O-methyltransferase [Prosthecochloris sp.]|uniref:Protein-L-isoaspartate O-methyltransferase n=1 Tax=Prosthecochloris aestuarii (strain DSM 271 / SK 413) TaxID=290512 RepID=B4S4E4_PROA2|nr:MULTISPECIES: protein-L-isoaspartate(D-aspartate) O-methyltransferase [Prosthecochloris]ACF45392.1 protein-L-isoaspartate O-methyltransferase [Prosthecochloris aestuarii DSM 271]MCW8797475.1 protein-L-isoaspartate(D-aspartate) O-methyltransferase [Prosthecochloris sp.]